MQLNSLLDLKADLWVIDCDGVIYNNTKEAENEVVNRMIKFIATRFGCGIMEASAIRQNLLKKYGVSYSIMALTAEGFNEQEILEETYFTIDLQKLGIISSPRLQNLFSSLTGKKVILTNNHGAYARKVLDQLEISEHFADVYGIGELNLIQKPDLQAFQFVQTATGIDKNIVFIDDELPNIIAASRFGWTAIWKGNSNGFDGDWITELR